MLHLALMSSENRAAHALGRNYPGGLAAFVAAMNAKAHELGMNDTHYVEPTGLSAATSPARATWRAWSRPPKASRCCASSRRRPNTTSRSAAARCSSTTPTASCANPHWDIGLQKTGFINEAGQCLVMQAKIAGRKLIMVLLDSAGKYSRIADAERMRRWISTRPRCAAVPQPRSRRRA